MKSLIKIYIVHTLSLFFISEVFQGIILERGTESLLLAGAGLALSSLVIKPIINILLLPLNLITFGLFRWVSSAVALYLVTLVVPGFKIVNFAFGGFSSKWFELPAFEISGILAFVAFSFAISVFTSIIHWVIK